MSSERTLSRGVQSAGTTLGLVEDEAEARRRSRPSPSDLAAPADAAIDEIAHREAHVGLVRRDARGDQPIAQRRSVGGVVDLDADDGLRP